MARAESSPSTRGRTPKRGESLTDTERAPTIAIIVLDCVRASDFPGHPGHAAKMPFCEALLAESLRFQNAVSPASWTIPGHGALFTGFPPEDTGCHWRGDLRLTNRYRTLAEVLHLSGYRTFALSANPIVCPEFDLTRGFERAAWAAWWEPYLRYGEPKSPPHQIPSAGPSAPVLLDRMRADWLNPLVKRAVAPVQHSPFIIEELTSLAQRIHASSPADGWSVARWIEPTVEKWLSSVRRDDPLFLFVNFVDAHEPYFRDTDGDHGLADYLRYVRTRQDNIGYIAGEWRARPGELERIHHLYVRMIENMDRRVQRIVDGLRAADRWQNTLLFLTADHGQCFGEHGHLFHFLRVDDPLVRVPLWLRSPNHFRAGEASQTWASLIDVMPTALEFAGVKAAIDLPGESLLRSESAERRRPVTVVSDGLPWGHFRRRFSPVQLRAIDSIHIAAYAGSRKLVVDENPPSVRLFDVESDQAETTDCYDSSNLAAQRLRDVARSIAWKMDRTARVATTPDVDERLRAWGYT